MLRSNHHEYDVYRELAKAESELFDAKHSHNQIKSLYECTKKKLDLLEKEACGSEEIQTLLHKLENLNNNTNNIIDRLKNLHYNKIEDMKSEIAETLKIIKNLDAKSFDNTSKFMKEKILNYINSIISNNIIHIYDKIVIDKCMDAMEMIKLSKV